MSAERYILFCDGASRGNPGNASFGVVCFKGDISPTLGEFKKNEKSAVFAVGFPLGVATNNEAEYRAILYALEECKKRGILSPTLYSDSELVVKQLNGLYKVKDAKMRVFFTQAMPLMRAIHPTIVHVRREKNQIADFLANRALDEALP